MIDRVSVSRLVERRRFAADGEASKSRELILMLLEHSPKPFSRDQFVPGHITASGLVLAEDGKRVLLVHHARLDRWLLPGGHVEAEDRAVEDAARREVIEETGVQLAASAAELVGVDVHGIPPKRGEPFHLHHDLIFLFRAASGEVRLSEESLAIAWSGPQEFDRYEAPAEVRRAYGRAVAV